MGGPFRIKMSEIAAYLHLIRMDEEDTTGVFLRAVLDMDGIWLKDYYDRQENKKPK